jgi:hypothetical protein
MAPGSKNVQKCKKLHVKIEIKLEFKMWELDEAVGQEDMDRPKKFTWTEHVWSTFIHRG